MNKVNVFLDLDGCVADFPKLLESLYGTADYDAIRDKIGAGNLWKELGQIDHLFLNLEPMPNFNTLFNYLNSLFLSRKIDRFEILTSIPRPTDKLHTAREDKIDWVRKYLDSYIPVNIVVGGTEKAKYVRSKYDVLIDDLPRNIEEWNKAGGTGILFTNNADAISELDKFLDSRTSM